MAAATCKLCKEKDRTILALEGQVQILLEMVNLQRAIPSALPTAPQAPAPAVYPPLTPVDGPDEDDPEEIMARLNGSPDLPEEEAEALMSRLQALNTRVERAD